MGSGDTRDRYGLDGCIVYVGQWFVKVCTFYHAASSSLSVLVGHGSFARSSAGITREWLVCARVPVYSARSTPSHSSVMPPRGHFSHAERILSRKPTLTLLTVTTNPLPFCRKIWNTLPRRRRQSSLRKYGERPHAPRGSPQIVIYHPAMNQCSEADCSKNHNIIIHDPAMIQLIVVRG